MRPARFTFRHAAASGHGSLLVASALVALLAAGCDYWDNLTEEKKPDKGELNLVVLDAWTKERLTLATCGDPGGKWSKRTDETALISIPEMATGTYEVACSCEHYFNRAVRVTLLADARDSVFVAMARKGGDDWYQDDSLLEVSLRLSDNTGRFPDKLQLQAYPKDASGLLKYEWASSYHKNLSSQTRSSLTLPMDSMPDKDTAEVAITLRIMSTLADSMYEVGSISRTIPLRRNLRPTIAFNGNIEDSVKVGCLTNPPVFRFNLVTRDPDGKCQGVVISNSDTTSSLEKFDSLLNCSQGQPMAFPLKTHPSGTGVSISRDNLLKFRVTDDNNQHYDTTLDFRTYSALPPVVSLEQEEIPDINFPNTVLKFRVKGGGGNSSYGKMTVDWGDGEVDPRSLLNKEALNEPFTHSYRSPGEYTATVRVVDKCNLPATADLTVTVGQNRLPKIGLLELRGFLPASNEY